MRGAVGSNARRSAADRGPRDRVPDQGRICLDYYRTTVLLLKHPGKEQLSWFVLLDSVTKQNFTTLYS